MDFTVAIPTYNGEQRLPDVLRRLQTQTGLEAINWEVLVVDNNSQDQTAAIVQTFQVTFPCPLRYCLEHQQGASYARQRAVREACSELIGFLDDDNLPDSGWVLAAYQFAQQHPQVGAYGSRITGEFEVEPPAHFQRIAPFMAIVERGSHPHRYEPEKKLLPPSAGLVVRKQAWLTCVPEQTLLNRLRVKRSDGNDCSEDIEALSYIQQSGWEIWHNPEMRIAHKIPAWRLERRYLLPLFRSIGLSRCATRLVNMKPHQRWWMTAAYMMSDLRRVILHVLKYHTQIKTDLVAACELQLYLGILISPIYLLAKQFSKHTS